MNVVLLGRLDTYQQRALLETRKRPQILATHKLPRLSRLTQNWGYVSRRELE